jgi:hypothetical protein
MNQSSRTAFDSRQNSNSHRHCIGNNINSILDYEWDVPSSVSRWRQELKKWDTIRRWRDVMMTRFEALKGGLPSTTLASRAGTNEREQSQCSLLRERWTCSLCISKWKYRRNKYLNSFGDQIPSQLRTALTGFVNTRVKIAILMFWRFNFYRH